MFMKLTFWVVLWFLRATFPIQSACHCRKSLGMEVKIFMLSLLNPIDYKTIVLFFWIIWNVIIKTNELFHF